MAGDVVMTIDDAEFMRMVNAGDRVYQLTAVSSLNKAGRKVRTQVIRRAAKEHGVSVPAVRKHAKSVRANLTRFEYRLGVIGMISARHLNPGVYGAAPGGTRPGPRGGIEAQGRYFESAFLAKDKGGKQRVFRRPGKTGLPKVTDRSEEAPRPLWGRGGRIWKLGHQSIKEPAIRSMKVQLTRLEPIIAAENQKGFEYMKKTLPGELMWRLERAAR